MTENTIPTFYREEAVPEKWTLADLLYWIAFGVLPQPLFYGEHEGRQSLEAFFENFTDFGSYLLPEWLEPVETQLLGLDNDPDWILSKREENGEGYLSSPEHHKKMSSMEIYEGASQEEQKTWELDREKDLSLIPVATEHQKYAELWKEKLADALDQFQSDLIIKLRRGEIKAEGIAIEVSTDIDFFDRAYEALEQRDIFKRDYNKQFSNIPVDFWISKYVNWGGSFLFKNTTAYMGIRVSVQDALTVFPPKSHGKIQFEKGSNYMFSYETKTQIESFKSKQGRPSKNWDSVHIKIAQIMQRDGGLPLKQDAMAQEILDWYRMQFNQSIGLSTIKAKLSEYYQDPSFKKI